MSIPPLVCNTPPPPEQCDDRDVDEFDIQYNLSQDDEDGHDYSYGTYSNYIYSTSTSTNIHQDIWSTNISKKTDGKLCNDLLEEKKDTINIMPENDSFNVNKEGYDDVILEDLNLKLEDQNDAVSLHNTNIDTEHCETDSMKDLSKQLPIVDDKEDNKSLPNTQDLNENTLLNNATETLSKDADFVIEETVVNKYTHENFHDDTIDNTKNVQIMEENNLTDELYHNVTEQIESNVPGLENHTIASNHELGELKDDDFGEFDDFQVTLSENNPTASITYCDNPWNSEDCKNSDFGNFTANFDADDICNKNNNDEENERNKNKSDAIVDVSDDFEDFDDFKSSSNDYKEEVSDKNEPSHNVPVFSLHSPESEIQIIESINGVLSSIFTSEILELDSVVEGNLESLLNETWGHLVDTDVRQSYIVNWNNSLGQKSLLKALCIDSRNILFGPKWNNNMPKYAANLTVAPLQPQKPIIPSTPSNTDEQHVDKTTNKETGTWTDPFTSDGQESCNSGSENTTTIARPANLDVFTNAISPEVDHIYSSTLTVQPIRQINLPDTHIFTPTDSETPRSKTIHYDQGPPMLVPQTCESGRLSDESNSKSKSEMSTQNTENDEDYWEFQDFKGSFSKNETSSNTAKPINNDSLHQTIKTYDTQILQPIKVEPITPALNWPNPGEVKERFDDFSEFVSNTSWNNENTDISNQSVSHLNKPEIGTEILEDDFETFQSAPTLKCTMPPINNLYPTTSNINHHDLSDFTQHFTDKSDISHSKTDGIVMPKESLVQSESPVSGTNNFTSLKDSHAKLSPVLSSGSQRSNATTMLVPVSNISVSQRTQQKTGQILQPLSLESYSQINWPSPGIDLQDLSRFNPVESLQSLKSDLSTGGSSKLASPAHKETTVRSEISDEDVWGDFVSSKPKQQMQPKQVAVFADDDEWTDFVSSPSVKAQNGLNTISLNVHTNLNMQKTSGPNKFHTKNNQLSLDIPTLKYVTPKVTNRGLYNEKHFQNL